MYKRIAVFIIGGIVTLNFYGCALLLAGAVGGAGTAVWLSDKLTQEVNSSLEKSVEAAKSAMNKLDLEIVKETKKDDVAQLISEYSDGKKTWIDIHKITQNSSRIEIRVGLTGDEEAARKIMDQIMKYL